MALAWRAGAAVAVAVQGVLAVAAASVWAVVEVGASCSRP